MLSDWQALSAALLEDTAVEARSDASSSNLVLLLRDAAHKATGGQLVPSRQEARLASASCLPPNAAVRAGATYITECVRHDIHQAIRPTSLLVLRDPVGRLLAYLHACSLLLPNLLASGPHKADWLFRSAQPPLCCACWKQPITGRHRHMATQHRHVCAG